MAVLPDAATVRAIPSWEWLRMHIDPARSRALVRAAQVADSLERLRRAAGRGGRPPAPHAARRSGCGRSAEVRLRALGDADAVSFGDYHLAKEVGWALFGHDIDDDELATVLEPYRPHRGRVAQLRRPRRRTTAAARAADGAAHPPARRGGGDG